METYISEAIQNTDPTTSSVLDKFKGKDYLRARTCKLVLRCKKI